MTKAFPVVVNWPPLADTVPSLSPSIQVVEVDPSLPVINNCLSPVAEPASTVPIITFPLPDVIFFEIF